MKTIEQRAKDLLFSIEYSDDRSKRLSRVLGALKEQDEITRHACAENISCIKKFVAYDGRLAIFKDEASMAIINTKAI